MTIKVFIIVIMTVAALVGGVCYMHWSGGESPTRTFSLHGNL
jgi:hypothetical protein